MPSKVIVRDDNPADPDAFEARYDHPLALATDIRGIQRIEAVTTDAAGAFVTDVAEARAGEEDLDGRSDSAGQDSGALRRLQHRRTLRRTGGRSHQCVPDLHRRGRRVAARRRVPPRQANNIGLRSTYPARQRFGLRWTVGCDAVWVSEYTIRYDDRPVMAVAGLETQITISPPPRHTLGLVTLLAGR
jgi:hypothetical protein